MISAGQGCPAGTVRLNTFVPVFISGRVERELVFRPIAADAIAADGCVIDEVC